MLIIIIIVIIILKRRKKGVHKETVQCCCWVAHRWSVSTACFANISIWNSGSTFVSVSVLLCLLLASLFFNITQWTESTLVALLSRKRIWKKNERKKKPPSCGCSAERRVSRELDLQYEMSVSHTCFVLSFFARSLLLPPTPTFQKHQCYCVRTWIFSLLIYIIAVL